MVLWAPGFWPGLGAMFVNFFKGEGKRRHAKRCRERAGNGGFGWGGLRKVPLPVWRPGCIVTYFHSFA